MREVWIERLVEAAIRSGAKVPPKPNKSSTLTAEKSAVEAGNTALAPTAATTVSATAPKPSLNASTANPPSLPQKRSRSDNSSNVNDSPDHSSKRHHSNIPSSAESPTSTSTSDIEVIDPPSTTVSTTKSTLPLPSSFKGQAKLGWTKATDADLECESRRQKSIATRNKKILADMAAAGVAKGEKKKEQGKDRQQRFRDRQKARKTGGGEKKDETKTVNAVRTLISSVLFPV